MVNTIRSRSRFVAVLLVAFLPVMAVGCQQEDKGVDAPLIKNAPPPPPPPAGKPVLTPGAVGGGPAPAASPGTGSSK